MVLAAEFTTTTLVAWIIVALVVGLILGWVLRPWLIGDRLRVEYEAKLAVADEEKAAVDAGLAAAEASLDAAKSELETRRADAVRMGAELAGASGRVNELEASLHQQALERDVDRERLGADAARIAALEARVVDLEAEAAGAVPVAPATAPVPDKESATRRVAEIAARTRGEGPAVDDDLKRIRGIGPVIEGLLKDMGITSFAQIARFRGDDIAQVAAALDSFPDRIERDDWMTSAVRLHQEKYGDPV